MQLAETAGRIPRSVIVCALATAIAAAGARSDRGAHRELSAAVLADGFAILDGTPDDRHVIQVDRDGGKQTRRAVPVIAPEARMVGTSRGVSMGWLEKEKLVLARVSRDGKLGEPTRYGRRVVRLCDGVASNARRWGIGWLEKDDRVWVLHGPTKSSRTIDDEGEAAYETSATRTVWCGVASAGKQIALLWRDNANRVFLNFCGDKKCGDTILRMPLRKEWTLAGIACTDAACLVAMRDGNGGAVLGWMTTKGRVVWSKPLADATPDTTFSLTAAGDQAFVVAYVAREGALASRVIESGSIVRAWADPASSSPPAVVWAGDRLLVAHRHGDSVAPEVVPLPR